MAARHPNFEQPSVAQLRAVEVRLAHLVSERMVTIGTDDGYNPYDNGGGELAALPPQQPPPHIGSIALRRTTESEPVPVAV